jgi:hypothetical protein
MEPFKPHTCTLCDCLVCCGSCVVIAEYPVSDEEVGLLCSHICKAVTGNQTLH